MNWKMGTKLAFVTVVFVVVDFGVIVFVVIVLIVFVFFVFVFVVIALWVRLNVKWEIGKCLPRPPF